MKKIKTTKQFRTMESPKSSSVSAKEAFSRICPFCGCSHIVLQRVHWVRRIQVITTHCRKVLSEFPEEAQKLLGEEWLQSQNTDWGECNRVEYAKRIYREERVLLSDIGWCVDEGEIRHIEQLEMQSHQQPDIVDVQCPNCMDNPNRTVEYREFEMLPTDQNTILSCTRCEQRWMALYDGEILPIKTPFWMEAS